ncbi:hypothetical protein N7489_004733 [Penicillium chrysogenum]|uniref:uncharacterized protein n=1 Tax=Penicillium chrysogenum TaxID=5076 RepID=UPI0024DF0AB4|nr:uncharacterized protein N7489_004733 [Penicillium chrysogenum]KAJ5244637.1 hypothetical protein N7489_004733 [Penicillium chrysogenum]KAJ5849022.1 hypothetical protein N7534_008340 [Penicillium rubens]
MVEERRIQRTLEIWSFERGEWKWSDRLRINPLDPSLLERLANLHNLRQAQCYRAATADGSNAFFVVSEHEKEKLAAEGRVLMEKELLWMAPRVLDRVEDERDTPPGS